MQKSQTGFTLVELVVVIVLLGILGVTALGKYQDLSLDAQNSANQGIASEMSGASAINLAARSLGTTNGIAIITATEDCSSMGGLFQTGSLPSGYTFTGTADCTSGGSFTCAIDNTANTLDTAANATILCTTQ